MKKIILIFAYLLFHTFTFSQENLKNPFPKTIFVSGSASMEIVPDEIYVDITLKEYQRKGNNKIELDTIKNEFLKYCKEAKIPDSTISIKEYSGDNNYFYRRQVKKNKIELFAEITYQIKFSNSSIVDLLIDKLDDNATIKFEIVKTSHSKITEYRKQLKIKAVKMAKEKGMYLTEAIGEKLGTAITIIEPNEQDLLNYKDIVRLRGVNQISNSNIGYNQDKYDNNNIVQVNFKKINLQYTVDILFALQ